MIEIIQGTPGSGKSAVSLCLGINHLLAGGALAANFDLVDHWAFELAGLNSRVRLGFLNRTSYATRLRNRCFRIGSAQTIFDLSSRLADCGLSPEFQAKREGKGLLILDEAQLLFNSRQWSNNKQWIEFFTQHRKLGWDVILIAHHIQMIDKQVRPLVEIETRFRNLKNIRLPILPIPLSPVNAFLQIRLYAGHGPGTGMVHSRRLSFLDMSIARLYDTLRVFAFDDEVQHITLQGVDPKISSVSIPDYMPDFFMGRRFALWRKKHFAKQQPLPVRRPRPNLPVQKPGVNLYRY